MVGKDCYQDAVLEDILNIVSTKFYASSAAAAIVTGGTYDEVYNTYNILYIYDMLHI